MFRSTPDWRRCIAVVCRKVCGPMVRVSNVGADTGRVYSLNTVGSAGVCTPQPVELLEFHIQ